MKKIDREVAELLKTPYGQLVEETVFIRVGSEVFDCWLRDAQDGTEERSWPVSAERKLSGHSFPVDLWRQDFVDCQRKR